MTKELIIVVLILALIYLYYQNKKLKGLPNTATPQTIYELDEDLIADRDSAIRTKNEAEQEALDLGNKLKLKNQEVTRKDQEIERLKSEKNKVETTLNKKLSELKEKYSKQGQLLDQADLENNQLVERIVNLEAKIKELEKKAWEGGLD